MPVAARHDRIWDYVIAVEEELQDGDAGAGDRTVAGRIGRVRRRTFREGLAEEVIAEFVEAGRDRPRVEDVGIQVDVEGMAKALENLAHDGSARLRTMTQMDPPFLIPHAVQGETRGRAQGGRDIRTAEGTEPILLGRADVRIPGICRRMNAAQDERSYEISLKEDVLARESAEVAA